MSFFSSSTHLTSIKEIFWIVKCCRLDQNTSDPTSRYFEQYFPKHCPKMNSSNENACWPIFHRMSLITKSIHWFVWILQSILVVLSWIHYHHLGPSREQKEFSLRKTLHQIHSEILLENRIYQRWIQSKENKSMKSTSATQQ